MTREEIFRIFDAVQPSIEDLNAYLDALCGKTPLKLAYDVNGARVYTHDVLKTECFVGIVIENTLFYAKGFSRKDLFDDQGNKLYKDMELNVQDILNWIEKHSGTTFSSKAHPMTDDECHLLNKNSVKLEETVLILKRHGLSMPKSDPLAVLNEKKDCTFCEYFEGHSRMEHFLNYADFWICAPK